MCLLLCNWPVIFPVLSDVFSREAGDKSMN